MEIGLRVSAENSFSGEIKHILSAYFTFVALDEQGKPTKVPLLTPETSDEKRRYQEADHRRSTRIKAAEEQEEFRKSFPRS
jgi:acyl-CoA hydrolase